MSSKSKNLNSSSEVAIFNQHNRREQIAEKKKVKDQVEQAEGRGFTEIMILLKKQGFKILKKKSNSAMIVMARRIVEKRTDLIYLDRSVPNLTMTTIISASERIAILERRKKLFGGEKQVWKPKDDETNDQYVVTVEGQEYRGLWAKAEEALNKKINSGKGVSLPKSRAKDAIRSLSSDKYSDIIDLASMEISKSDDPEAYLERLIRVGCEDRTHVAETILRKLNIKVPPGNNGLTITSAIKRAKDGGKSDKDIAKAAKEMMENNPRCNRKAA